MINQFRIREEIVEASRKGDPLYSIYQILESSPVFLQEQQKSLFQLLFETLISSLTKEISQELICFPLDSLDIPVLFLSLPIAQILSQFKGKI